VEIEKHPITYFYLLSHNNLPLLIVALYIIILFNLFFNFQSSNNHSPHHISPMKLFGNVKLMIAELMIFCGFFFGYFDKYLPPHFSTLFVFIHRRHRHHHIYYFNI
jgi:hypothetical protein